MMQIHKDYIRAGHPDIDHKSLHQLAGHEVHMVRRRVAEHKRTPAALLEKLSRDPHPDVRAAVALHPDVPSHILLRLCEDESVDVRHALAESSCLPFDVLEFLTADENPYVAARARRTIERKLAPGPATIVCLTRIFAVQALPQARAR